MTKHIRYLLTQALHPSSLISNPNTHLSVQQNPPCPTMNDGVSCRLGGFEKSYGFVRGSQGMPRVAD